MSPNPNSIHIYGHPGVPTVRDTPGPVTTSAYFCGAFTGTVVPLISTLKGLLPEIPGAKKLRCSTLFMVSGVCPGAVALGAFPYAIGFPEGGRTIKSRSFTKLRAAPGVDGGSVHTSVRSLGRGQVCCVRVGGGLLFVRSGGACCVPAVSYTLTGV